MSVTPQTNTTIEEISEVILKGDNFCICGHINPDCDCIGSGLALAAALDLLGKNVTLLLADDAPLDETFAFLPRAEEYIPAREFEGICDCFIVVDAPNGERIGGEAAKIHGRAKSTITIDHHAVPERMSDLSYTDPDAASTTLLIWELAKHLGVDRRGDVATCAYAGLVTDTGRFMFQNTDRWTFASACEMVENGADPAEISKCLFQERSLASLRADAVTIENMEVFCDGEAVLSYITREQEQAIGANRNDLENSINVIRGLRGTRIACMLKEGDTSIRGSLRSKGDIDIAVLAQRFGGGGHVSAAGFTLTCPMDEAIRTMREAIEGYLTDLEGGAAERETR